MQTNTKSTRNKQLKTRSARSKVEKHQTQETVTRYKHSWSVNTGYGNYKESYHEDSKNKNTEEVNYHIGQEKTSWTEYNQYKKSDTNKEEDRAWNKLPGNFRTYLLAIFSLVILITIEIGYSSIRTLGTENLMS